MFFELTRSSPDLSAVEVDVAAGFDSFFRCFRGVVVCCSSSESYSWDLFFEAEELEDDVRSTDSSIEEEEEEEEEDAGVFVEINSKLCNLIYNLSLCISSSPTRDTREPTLAFFVLSCRFFFDVS